MSSFDFIAQCRPGMVLRTKDRREARIDAVDPAVGRISGQVQMFGPCIWTAEGRFADAPAGAAGPLDLVAPPAETASSAPQARESLAPESQARESQARESLAEALNDPAARAFCCD